jgi:hypothetical protein
MKNESLSATKAKRILQNLVNELLNLFLLFKARIDELLKLRDKSKQLDENNTEYYEFLHDMRENTKMNLKFILIIFSFLVDFFLLYGALEILCNQFGWPQLLKFLIPVILIVLEIFISYFSILQSRDEENPSLGKNLQYFVLPILIGFSLLAIFYQIQSYNEAVDGMSLISYMSFSLIIQIVLLIASIMLHLWLIKYAEEITEAIAYWQYKVKRAIITHKIESIERMNASKYLPLFTKLAHKYVKDIDTFKRNYPDVYLNFSKAMPQELIDAINRIMGKTVIAEEVDAF